MPPDTPATHLGHSDSEPIDRTYGESRASYDMTAKCTNCGWEGAIRTNKGLQAWRAAMDAYCPRCECKSVKAGEWIGDA